ncbi:MAG: PKD domain-containing protein [Patescibacteria group bacterium]|jgi:PKD repeat protein
MWFVEDVTGQRHPRAEASRTARTYRDTLLSLVTPAGIQASSAELFGGAYAVRVECANSVSASTQITVTSATPRAVPEGTLTTDKMTYAPGESVILTFTNTGTVPVTCGEPMSVIMRGDQLVYPETRPLIATVGEPGSIRTQTWNQRDNVGSQVPDGVYVAIVECSNLIRQATFTISSQTVQTLDFTVTPSEGQAPLTVVAEYKGTVDPTTLTWDFGDGSPALTGGALRSHVYPVTGTYTVTLRSGSTGVGTKQVVVTAPTTPPTDPGTPSPPNTSGTGPTLTNASSPTAIASLVSTGGNLVVNLAVAALLSLLAAWLILRPKRQA